MEEVNLTQGPKLYPRNRTAPYYGYCKIIPLYAQAICLQKRNSRPYHRVRTRSGIVLLETLGYSGGVML